VILQDWVHCLEQLHAKFGDKPALVAAMTPEVRRAYYEFRMAFLQEELDELRSAETAEDVVDAVIDLCVVAVGTLHAFGVDAREAWRRVQEANMAKSPGSNPNRPNKFGLPDLIKPDGWQAPDHSGNTGLLGVVVSGSKS
jgi:predicted HAD superfamily Cof-like phosphohydrolase